MNKPKTTTKNEYLEIVKKELTLVEGVEWLENLEGFFNIQMADVLKYEKTHDPSVLAALREQCEATQILASPFMEAVVPYPANDYEEFCDIDGMLQILIPQILKQCNIEFYTLAVEVDGFTGVGLSLHCVHPLGVIRPTTHQKEHETKLTDLLARMFLYAGIIDEEGVMINE